MVFTSIKAAKEYIEKYDKLFKERVKELSQELPPDKEPKTEIEKQMYELMETYIREKAEIEVEIELISQTLELEEIKREKEELLKQFEREWENCVFDSKLQKNMEN